MGKVTVLLLAAATAIGVGGPAQAGQVRIKPDPVALRGSIEKGGRAHVDVSYVRRHGRLFRRYEYEFSGIVVRCKGRWRETRDPLSGAEMIWAKYADRNPFGTTAVSGPLHDPSYKGDVRGKLVKPTKARGWVRVSGRRVPLEGGGQRDCDSGRLHWVARDQPAGRLPGAGAAAGRLIASS